LLIKGQVPILFNLGTNSRVREGKASWHLGFWWGRGSIEDRQSFVYLDVCNQGGLQNCARMVPEDDPDIQDFIGWVAGKSSYGKFKISMWSVIEIRGTGKRGRIFLEQGYCMWLRSFNAWSSPEIVAAGGGGWAEEMLLLQRICNHRAWNGKQTFRESSSILLGILEPKKSYFSIIFLR
jgi:hypothetical protein